MAKKIAKTIREFWGPVAIGCLLGDLILCEGYFIKAAVALVWRILQ